MRVRIFPTNRANPVRVVAPPALRLFAVIVFCHKVALGGVVLPNRNDDDMRREAAEIPRFFVVEERVVRQLIPAGQHPRIKEIAVAILQGNAALRNIADFGIQQPRRLPCVAEPYVIIPRLMVGRVKLPGVFGHFADFACRHTVTIELNAPIRARGRRQERRAFVNQQRVERHLVAAVLPLEEHHVVLAVAEVIRKVDDVQRVPVQQHAELFAVDDDAEAVLPEVVCVRQHDAEVMPGHAEADERGGKEKHRVLRVSKINAPGVLEIFIIKGDSLFARQLCPHG